MCGFIADAGVFFHYALIVFLIICFFTYLAVLFAWALPSPEISQIWGGMIIALAFIFAGLLVSAPAIPRWWIWLYYLNPAAYAVEALTSPQFHCVGGIAAGCPTLTLIDGGALRQVVISDYVAEFFGFNYGDRWIDVGILAAFVVGTVSVALLALWRISWVKR